MKRLFLAVVAVLALAAVSSAAPITRLTFTDSAGFVAIDTLSYTTTGGSTTTLTFTESGAPFGQLDGTTFYDPLGVSFVNSFRFGPDARLPDDGFGITNVPGTPGIVDFSDDIATITLTWALAGGDPAGDAFFADAFDSSGGLVDSFAFTGSGSTSGVATLAMATAPVPEPAAALMYGIGMGVVGWRIRRRSR